MSAESPKEPAAESPSATSGEEKKPSPIHLLKQKLSALFKRSGEAGSSAPKLSFRQRLSHSWLQLKVFLGECMALPTLWRDPDPWVRRAVWCFVVFGGVGFYAMVRSPAALWVLQSQGVPYWRGGAATLDKAHSHGGAKNWQNEGQDGAGRAVALGYRKGQAFFALCSSASAAVELEKRKATAQKVLGLSPSAEVEEGVDREPSGEAVDLETWAVQLTALVEPSGGRVLRVYRLENH